MKVKSIRGSIKYNGIVYEEGKEFEIDEIHLEELRENVEITRNINADKKEKQKDDDIEIEEETQEADYSKMKKSELIKIAQQKGIVIPDKATNTEIIQLLQGR